MFIIRPCIGPPRFGQISNLAARGRSQSALRADFFRQLCVPKFAKYSSMPVIWRLDLTKNLSLSPADDFCHGLLAGVSWQADGAERSPGLRQARYDAGDAFCTSFRWPAVSGRPLSPP